MCDAAVEAADSGIRPAIMDSRGVARAMLNDAPGAIADFEAFVSSSDGGDQTELRRTWIAALRRGQNPMTQRQVDRLILP